MLMDVAVGERSSEMFVKVLMPSNSSSFYITPVSLSNSASEVDGRYRMYWGHIHFAHLIPFEDL